LHNAGYKNMKTIKEKVLFDMKTRHPEYECRNHEIAIDLTIKAVLEKIDKLQSNCKYVELDILKKLKRLRDEINKRKNKR